MPNRFGDFERLALHALTKGLEYARNRLLVEGLHERLAILRGHREKRAAQREAARRSEKRRGAARVVASIAHAQRARDAHLRSREVLRNQMHIADFAGTRGLGWLTKAHEAS